MAETQDLTLKLTADTAGFTSGLQQAETSAKKFNTAMEELKNAGLGITAGLGAVAGVIGAVIGIAERGQAVVELSNAFKALGGTSADLDRLKTATEGLVSEIDLMAASNKALQAGLKPEQFQLLAGAADALGDVVGKNTKEALNDLTQAVVAGNERMLKQYGIIIDNEQAEKKFAESIGATASQLNEAGKLEARRTAELEAIAEKSKNAGEATKTVADEYERLKNIIGDSIGNFAAAIDKSQILTQAFHDFANGIDIVIQKISGLGSTSARGFEILQQIGQLEDENKAGGNFITNLFPSVRDEIIKQNNDKIDHLKAEYDLLYFTVDNGTKTVQQNTQAAHDNRNAYIDAGKAAADAAKAGQKAWDDFSGTLKTRFGNDGTIDQLLNNLPIIGENSGERDIVAERLEEQFQKSTDFFANILDQVFHDGSTNFEEFFIQAGESIATNLGAQLLASITDSFTADTLKSLGKQLLSSLGLDHFGGEGGLGGLLSGSGIGSLLGVLGVAAGGAVGYEQLSGARNAAKGGQLSAGEQLALALPTFGLSFAVNPISKFFGGDSQKAQERLDREGILQQLFGDDRSFRGVNGLQQLSPRYTSSGGQFGDQATALANPFAQVAAGGSGKLASDLANTFSAATGNAKNFNEVIVNTQALMDKLGTNATETKDAVTQLFLDGKISLQEFSADVANLNILAQDNLVGKGSVSDAIDIMTKNIDTNPRAALKGLQLAFVEMSELGITSSQEVHDYIAANFTPDVVAAFDKIEAAGLGSFEAIGKATPDQLVQVFDALSGVQDVVVDTTDAIDEMGNTGDDATDRVSSGLDRVTKSAENARKSIDKARDSLEKFSEASAGIEAPV